MNILYLIANFGPPIVLGIVVNDISRRKNKKWLVGADALLAISSIMITAAVSFYEIEKYVCPPLTLTSIPITFLLLAAFAFILWLKIANPLSEKFGKLKYEKSDPVAIDYVGLIVSWIFIGAFIIFNTMVFIWRKLPI